MHKREKTNTSFSVGPKMANKTNIRTSVTISIIFLVMGMAGDVARAGIDYRVPPGGWTYIYNGDQDTNGPTKNFDSLDGTWDHDNGSDEWDGTQIFWGRPAGGDGYVIHDGGKGIGIHQQTGGKMVSFHLCLGTDGDVGNGLKIRVSAGSYLIAIEPYGIIDDVKLCIAAGRTFGKAKLNYGET